MSQIVPIPRVYLSINLALLQAPMRKWGKNAPNRVKGQAANALEREFSTPT